MGRTRTSGITTDGLGGRIIKKEVLGKIIYRRIGQVPKKRQSRFSPERSSEFVSPGKRERVLALLSEKLRSST